MPRNTQSRGHSESRVHHSEFLQNLGTPMDHIKGGIVGGCLGTGGRARANADGPASPGAEVPRCPGGTSCGTPRGAESDLRSPTGPGGRAAAQESPRLDGLKRGREGWRNRTKVLPECCQKSGKILAFCSILTQFRDGHFVVSPELRLALSGIGLRGWCRRWESNPHDLAAGGF